MRESSSGPMSEIVARTGWPCLPNTSQNTTGQAAKRASSLSGLMRSATRAFAPPALAMPGKVAFHVGHEHRHADRRETPAPATCSVTVLPVPVAPVIRPWRLASAGSSTSSAWPFFAMSRGWTIEVKLYAASLTYFRINSWNYRWPDTANGRTSSTARGARMPSGARSSRASSRRSPSRRASGGADPATNPRLRLAMDKAREANMPKDGIQNAIARGAGTLEGVTYEEIRYEGYGIGGAAVIVDCMTDNRTRTVAEVRHAFAKNGGNLGTDGSVAFLFKHCGQFLFAPGLSEDKVMEAALDAGAEDVVANEDGSIEVICAPADFDKVKAALEKAGLKPEIAEITMKPTLENALAGDDAVKMRKLLDALEEPGRRAGGLHHRGAGRGLTFDNKADPHPGHRPGAEGDRLRGHRQDWIATRLRDKRMREERRGRVARAHQGPPRRTRRSHRRKPARPIGDRESLRQRQPAVHAAARPGARHGDLRRGDRRAAGRRVHCAAGQAGRGRARARRARSRCRTW